MIQLNLRTDPRTAATPMLLTATVSTRAGIDANAIKRIAIRKRSIDARQRNIMVNLTVDVYLKGEPDREPDLPGIELSPLSEDARQAIVIGAGPAGLFAALELIHNGIRPILLERGCDVEQRRKDVAQIARDNIVLPDSNYCFGEGGAGAFSDGKLYTRSKKRGPVEAVLGTLVRNGASPDILVDAHPHIGSNRLPQVIASIRRSIIDNGGRVFFNTRVTALKLVEDADGGRRCVGVVTESGESFSGPVILATGHSARDVYRMLSDADVTLEAKGIAVGVRVEHPQELIDKIFYHNPNGRGKFLPPAEYSLLTRVGIAGPTDESRAVYSFCMCPGGIIIPAASAPGELVVNGMSPANRGSRWANTGMVVEVLPQDVPDSLSADRPELKMMAWQHMIEQNFYQDARQTQNAPAQRMTDFVASRPSKNLPSTSYAPGIHPARIDRLLPHDVAERLAAGLKDFGRRHRGYLSPEATLIGCETRTSAPVRVPRKEDTLSHIDISGLYPAGEGAGYAGGIVSAAIDGMRCADALAAGLRSE